MKCTALPKLKYQFSVDWLCNVFDCIWFPSHIICKKPKNYNCVKHHDILFFSDDGHNQDVVLQQNNESLVVPLLTKQDVFHNRRTFLPVFVHCRASVFVQSGSVIHIISLTLWDLCLEHTYLWVKAYLGHFLAAFTVVLNGNCQKNENVVCL